MTNISIHAPRAGSDLFVFHLLAITFVESAINTRFRINKFLFVHFPAFGMLCKNFFQLGIICKFFFNLQIKPFFETHSIILSNYGSYLANPSIRSGLAGIGRILLPGEFQYLQIFFFCPSLSHRCPNKPLLFRMCRHVAKSFRFRFYQMRQHRFQSTLPVRGATAAYKKVCGAPPKFQSTLPVRGATTAICWSTSPATDFNPRSPCGERRDLSAIGSSEQIFQSTLPVRGATHFSMFEPLSQYISIHAPRAGSD